MKAESYLFLLSWCQSPRMRRSHRRSAEDNQNQEPGPEAGRKTEKSSPSQTFSSRLFRHNINLSCCSSYQYYGLSAVRLCVFALYHSFWSSGCRNQHSCVSSELPSWHLQRFPPQTDWCPREELQCIQTRNREIRFSNSPSLEDKQANIIKKRNLFP